jgi:hypothetical protein
MAGSWFELFVTYLTYLGINFGLIAKNIVVPPLEQTPS